MAHAKTRPDAAPGAAPSAAHAAPDPAPAPGTGPAPGSPAAAIHAALTASPGATTAAIADAAGTGKAAARDALLAMEQAGTATRVKAAKPGIPDTWTLAGAAQDAGPAAGPEDEQDAQPDGGPGTGQTAAGAVQGAAAGTASPRQQDGDAGDGTSAAADPGTDKPRPHDDAPAGDSHQDAGPAEQHDEAVPDSGGPQDPHGSDTPRDPDAVPADGGEAGAAPDPALVTEITGRITQISAAAGAAATALTEDGNLRSALAGLDEIAEQAAQARRSLKAALGGRTTPAARPGGLRGKVLAHLEDHPDATFTPHEIHKVLGNSSGAIANALDTLVKRGEAELAAERPRRFRLAAGQPAPAAAGGGRRGPRRGRQHGTGGCRVRTRADGRGGSTPPRPPGPPSRSSGSCPCGPGCPASAPPSHSAAAAPRRARPSCCPVQPRAPAHGLLPAPGGGPRAVCLTGPGPDSGPGYAVGAGLDEPVIIATVTGPDGEPPVPVLTGGCHRLYKGARTGRAHLPSLVLTAAGAPAVRRDAVPGPARRPGRTESRP